MGTSRVPSRTFIGYTSLDGALSAAVFAFPLCCGVVDVFSRPLVLASDLMREELPWSTYRAFVTTAVHPTGILIKLGLALLLCFGRFFVCFVWLFCDVCLGAARLRRATEGSRCRRDGAAAHQDSGARAGRRSAGLTHHSRTLIHSTLRDRVTTGQPDAHLEHRNRLTLAAVRMVIDTTSKCLSTAIRI